VRWFIAAGLAAAVLSAGGCTAHPAAHNADAKAGLAGHGTQQVGPPGVQASGLIRLGLQENLADSAALLGWQMGFFGQNLSQVTLEPEPFTSSGAEAEALENEQLDAAYLDPVTALQVWQAHPDLIKIVAGAASGGSELVVAPSITSAAQLKGQPVAAAGGATERAAADSWLGQQGLSALTPADTAAGSDASLVQAFKSGKIAGAWESPPLDVELTAAGGHVLVKEDSLWSGGTFPTAVLVVTQQLLTANPAAVTGLLKGQIQTDHYLADNQASAEAALGQRLTSNGDPIPTDVLDQSFTQFAYTENPFSGSLLTEAKHAVTAGLLKPFDSLTSAYDLDPLNQLLTTVGRQPISTASA
jgi:NitT/TauT family transport system substrate-binding protein